MRTALVAVLLLAACSSSGGASGPKPSSHAAPRPTFVIRGDFSIAEAGTQAFTISQGQCAGTGGASSIVPGAPVKVSDLSGKTLATGKLGVGKGRATMNVGACTFPFAVSGVPDGQAFYRVTFAGHGPEQYARARLNRPLHATFVG